MAITISTAVKTHKSLTSNSARPLNPWNNHQGLEYVLSLNGPGEEFGRLKLAAVIYTQAVMVGWNTLLTGNHNKTWLASHVEGASPINLRKSHDDVESLHLWNWSGAVTSLFNLLLEQAWTLDCFLGEIWNRREDLLYKDYFRFLSKEEGYPCSEQAKDVWFTAPITRHEDVNGRMEPRNYEIQALNSTDKNKTGMSEEEELKIEVESKPGYWYHGTSYISAMDIIKEGIKLNRGMAKQDFSSEGGFYMSPTFICAKKWAIKTNERAAAVIVFNVKKRLEELQMQGLDLTGNDRLGDWKAVVKYNRCGGCKPWAPLSGQLRKTHDGSDYILGPMSGGPVANCPSYKPACEKWTPRVDKNLPNQLCIKKERLAEVFGSLEKQHIEAVVFFGD